MLRFNFNSRFLFIFILEQFLPLHKHNELMRKCNFKRMKMELASQKDVNRLLL